MKKAIHKVVPVLVLCLILGNVQGQDIQLSQYYNLVQYSNPAFVGSSMGWRATFQNRLQWPGVDSRYATSIAAMDYNLSKYRSGVGGMLIVDDQGASSIKTYQGIAQYSYQLNLSSASTLRAGTSVGYVRRTLANSNLYYPSQFNGTGFDNSDNSSYSRNYLDIGAGILFHTSQFWIGLSAAHLNRPNQAFLGNADRLPTRFDVLAGYKIVLHAEPTMRYLEKNDKEVWALYPSVLLKSQGKSTQMDIGLYSLYDVFQVGLWYRGIPIKNYSEQIINNEALILSAGCRFDHFSVTYSYDLSISKLSPYSKGAHEISLNFLMPRKGLVRSGFKYKILPCPRL